MCFSAPVPFPRNSLLNTDRTDGAAVPGLLGAGELVVGDVAAVGQAVVPHGEAHGAGAGAQAAADAAFVDCRSHGKASLYVVVTRDVGCLKRSAPALGMCLLSDSPSITRFSVFKPGPAAGR